MPGETGPGFERDFGVDPKTGLLRPEPGSFVNCLPFPVPAGTVLRLKREGLNCGIFIYSREIPGELIHTYTYQPESNWTTYRPDRSVPDWDGTALTLDADGYVRLVVRGAGATDTGLPDLIEGGAAEDALSPFAGAGRPAVPAWLAAEAERTSERVLRLRRDGDLTLFLLSDTHDAVNGIWPDTLQSLRLSAEKLHPDGIVHLGDFVDGLLPGKCTEWLVRRQLQPLRSLSENCFVCVGNHDWNYFRGNSDRLTEKETAERYLGREEPRYFADLPDKKLRMIFPDSFDPNEKERYGFSEKTVRWFAKTLRTTPEGWRVLVFSHVTPVSALHVWSSRIRNGERMLDVLEKAERKSPGRVICWIHGHSHADQVWRGRRFPVVGIGCAKLEDFAEHKPEGSVTYAREQGTSLQELWDVLIVHAEGGADFVRFGAGEDRHIDGEGSHDQA